MTKVNRIFVEVGMTTDKSAVLFRCQPELRAWLERIAREQNRSLSNLCETGMLEWAKENGYRPEPKPKRTKR